MDAFFVQSARRTQTSANVFSVRVLPLSVDEYAAAIPIPRIPQTRCSAHSAFPRLAHQLVLGFSLVFYGLGSKRAVLNDLANDLARRGHVVVVNGFHPETTLKDVLASIERVPGLAPSSTTADAQLRRVCAFFAAPDAPRLFLVVHNIDAPPMRNPKMRNALSLLALSQNIHLAASVDRLAAPLLWSASELLARKVPPSDASPSPKRGYAFLWHDLTTLLPYDTELSFADRSSIAGASYATTGTRSALAATATQGASAPLTESAVAHVLAAVTAKAKKLFVLLGSRQLANADAAADATSDPPTDLAQFGLGYDALFSLAREHFVATSDTALRALLGEFKDHGLILTGPAPTGGDVLWIPLRRERLVRVLKSIETEPSE